MNKDFHKASHAIWKAIRQSGNYEKLDFTHPEDDVVVAYLLGSATEEQQQVVLRAMEESAAFRREMIDMVRDLQSLPDVETSRNPLAAILRNAFSGTATFLSNAWQYMFSSRVGAIAVTTALIVIVSVTILYRNQMQLTGSGESPITSAPSDVSRTNDRPANIELAIVSSDIEKSSLVTLANRSVGTGHESATWQFADSAALAAFREYVVIDSNFMIDIQLPAAMKTVSNFEALVTFVQNDSSQFALHVPLSGQINDSVQATLWVLSMDSGTNFSLFNATISDAKPMIDWKSSQAVKGIACITTKTPNGYVTSGGVPFSIHEKPPDK